MNNNPDGELTTKDQYKKLKRAMYLIYNITITEDEYLAILQLMNAIDYDACLVLDNTHESH